MFIITVGTFGVASGSYYWSRVATAIGPLSQYLAGSSAYTWHMLVADDFHLDAGDANCWAALFHFFTLCATANVPLSWGKTAGGDVGWFRTSSQHSNARNHAKKSRLTDEVVT